MNVVILLSWRLCADIMEVFFFFKVCQSFIATYMVCQYWTSVILLDFQLLPYHDFFYNEQNVTITIFDDAKSQQGTEHLMQTENIVFFEIEGIFLSFSRLGFFFPFLVKKWFWQKVGVTLEVYIRKTDLKDTFRHLVLSQQRMDHSLTFSLASSSFPR